MGYQNVSLVYARWTHLPDQSFIVLGMMALRSLDEDDPPLYWGGREELAFALGRRTPDEPASSDSSARAMADRKARAADFQAVKRAVYPLLSAGVVTVITPSAPRRSAVYGLDLLAGTGYATRTEQGTPGVPTGYATRTEQGTRGVPAVGGKGGVTFVKKATTREQQQTPRSPNVSTSPAADAEYEKAKSILESLPDHGAEYLRRVPTDWDDWERTIKGAALFTTENPDVHILKTREAQ